MAAAWRPHRIGRRPGAGRVARGEGRKRTRRGTARRTSAHDFARHPCAHRAALSRHPSHQRHARTHRHDLLGAAKEWNARARAGGASRHPLVQRGISGKTPAADDGRRKMVLPPGPRGDSPRVNPAKKFRAACYTIEGLNSFAVVIYFNYLYFLFRDRFGFNDKQNLALAALIGLIYTFASWQAGRFAQRCGYFTALKIGFGLMAAGLAAGSRLDSVTGQIVAACF